jgi:diguanylate cyclase (GGDEF)-like protein
MLDTGVNSRGVWASRKVTTEPVGERARRTLSRFDDRLRHISTALFATGMLVVLLVANTRLVRPHTMDQSALNWLVIAAGVSIAGILLFPWHRYNRNLFLVATFDGLCLIALAVYFSGGWESPFFPFYFYVVVFCAIYFSPRVAAPTVLFTVLVSLSTQLYEPDASQIAEHAIVRVPSYLAVGLVSWYMAREIGRRERLRGEYERRLEEMQLLKDRFQKEASTDHLTGLPNRSTFEAQLRVELERARRRGEESTMLFFDMDDFKQINDAHGHRVGDEALKLVAEVLRLNTRDTDAIARYGGEEFVVLLRGTSPDRARYYFGKVREEVAHRSQKILGIRLSVSAGAVSFPRDDEDPEDLLEAADLAMYRAKYQGKNRLSETFQD